MVRQMAQATTPRVRLGELLVKAGVISDAQLQLALQEQRRWGGKLGDILVRMQFLSEDVFVRALSKQLGMPRADLARPIPLEALAKVPAYVAESYEVLPLALADEGRALVVATSDPLNVAALDALRAMLDLRLVVHVAGAGALRALISRLYQGVGLEETLEPLPIELNTFDGLPRPAPAAPEAAPFPAAPAPAPAPAAPMPMPMPPPGAYGFNPFMPYAPVPAPMPWAPPAVDDAARRERELTAIKALVELLVQKGVITLDEYLARLNRL